MFRRLLLSSAALATLVPGLARADVKPSLKDRFEQIVATFMGDPAANVDIDLKHVLDAWRAMKPKPLDELSPEDARRQPSPVDAAKSLLQKQGKTLDPYAIDTKDIEVAGAAGQLKTRVYMPKFEGKGKSELHPVVVFFHGGGFVLENASGTEASARTIAHATNAIVIAPAYRLAPEHKFPAAPDDCLAAYKWVTQNAQSLGGDPDRIAIAGEGAGGNLAVDTAIAARAVKLAEPVALALITPASGTDLKTNSWLEDSAARPWNLKAVQWALKLYLPDEAAKNDPRIDIVGKADVEGLPLTIIVTAEDDPLRSDGERLGGKMKRATVPVEVRDYPGMTHDFFGMGVAVSKASEAERFIGENLKKAFHPSSNATIALEQLGVAPYPEASDPPLAPPPASVTIPKSTKGMPPASVGK